MSISNYLTNVRLVNTLNSGDNIIHERPIPTGMEAKDLKGLDDEEYIKISSWLRECDNLDNPDNPKYARYYDWLIGKNPEIDREREGEGVAAGVEAAGEGEEEERENSQIKQYSDDMATIMRETSAVKNYKAQN